VVHPQLFEISAWPWLERLSRRENRLVTLADVSACEWDLIAARGFTHVFMMGVWKRSPLGREMALGDRTLHAEYDHAVPGWRAPDVVGSPYCIQSYEPDPRMGGWDGVDAARRSLNARGLGLVLDFVPNHTAFDHPWTCEHPDRYVLGSTDDEQRAPHDFRRVGTSIVACGRDPYFLPWRDVAQLNYFNPDTRRAMAAELRTVAAHCDGVRCDMAMLVLNEVFERTWRHILRERWTVPAEEFWPGTIAACPRLLFLAEVYWDLEWTLQQQGFHFTYDKRLLDRLHGSTPDDVRGHLRAAPDYSARLARFLENHDEPRSAATLAHRLPAAAAIVATLPGMRFYFDGQIEGRMIRTPVQLGRWADEPSDARSVAIYERLLATASTPLLRHGEWRLLETSSAGDSSFGDLIAFRWRLGDAVAVVVANLGIGNATGHVPIVADLPAGNTFDFTDRLTDVTYRWARRSLDVRGLYVRLEPGAAHVFVATVTNGRME
jgi:glycosidase